MLRGIIAEDNSLIRKTLEDVILSFGSIDIIYSVGSGDELWEILEFFLPGILFLDIGLPGRSGIEITRHARLYHPFIEIVFITSHEKYLKEAVELYAADYILKPLNVARLKKLSKE